MSLTLQSPPFSALSSSLQVCISLCTYIKHDYECMYEWLWFLILIAGEVEVLTWSWIDSFKSGALQQRSEIVSANSSFLVLARHWSISLLLSLIRSSLLQSRISFFCFLIDLNIVVVEKWLVVLFRFQHGIGCCV